MPYKAFEADNEWCVFKLDEEGEPSGKALGCHPSKAKANAQVKALYANEPEMEGTEESKMEVIVDGLLKLAEAAGLLAKQITEAFAEDDSDAEPVAETVNLGESSVGAVLSIRESEDVVDGPAPLQLDIAVIEPGWGNKRDNHYYGAEMLKANAAVFKGAKMYATDHREDEKNVRTEVSQVLDCPVGFTETGAPIARVGVFDEQFAASVRNRAALGKLEDLEVSILASGTARPLERDGRKGKQIESISSEGVNVDWVTRAGAGGRALRLAEVEDDMGDEVQVEDQVKVEDEVVEEPELEPTEEPEDEAEPEPVEQADPEPVEEVKVSETEEIPAPVTLAEADVKEALRKSTLPDVSRERLTAFTYTDTITLQEAIDVEKAYVAQLTGAGRPVGQELVASAEQKSGPTLEERYDEIEKRLGVSH